CCRGLLPPTIYPIKSYVVFSETVDRRLADYLAFSSVWTLVLYLAASIVSQRAEGPRFPSETAATYTLPVSAVLTLSRRLGALPYIRILPYY
ncbi:hypothetical protein, partial [Chitinophaga sp. S165]|uniref:hypothetical protein n=1 Tax=Chitinophaga sp. S165 TaxID=2135462 RepID=UPI001E543E11